MGNNKLFEDDGFGDDTILDEIKIDQEFARRFEYNNTREDLQRYEDLKQKEAISDSDSDSDSDSEVEFRKEDDVEFLDVLLKVKNQDPILKNKEIKLFKSDSESKTEDENLDINGWKVKEKKRKKSYLKDVIAKQLIEEGPEFEENDVVRNKVKSCAEVQEEFKRAFFDADEEMGEEDGDELLRVKSNGDGKENDDDEEDQEIAQKIDQVYPNNELDTNTTFLKEYFSKRMWVGEAGEVAVNAEEVSEDEDLDETWRQSDYEKKFNFRFEQNAEDRVMGHARTVDDSVRKKENKRKEQRERKKMRQEKVTFEMKEELKHLKNLKKKEMHEKVRKIWEVAGFGEDGDCLMDVSDLEEEFDPEAHDKKMSEAFDDKYYEAEDIDPEFGRDSDSDEDGGDIQKPDFDKEDELLGLPNGWDHVYKSGDCLDPDSKEKFDKEDDLLGLTNGGDELHKSDGGFRAARQKVLKLKAENGVNSDLSVNLEDEATQPKKKMKKEVSEEVKEVIDKYMDEYHKLEYEDTIGDLKTRFKYRPVKPKRFGLTDNDILLADSKLLNQLVPLNKLAPYMEKEWKPSRMKALEVKQQIRGKRRKESIDVTKAGNEFRPIGEKRKSSNEGPQPEGMNSGTSNQSRRAKRRRAQASLKLTHERLLAYGKIPSKPKSRKKSLSSV